MTDITWHTEQRKLGDLTPWDRNPRQLTKKQAKDLKASMERFGLADPLVINLDNLIIGGHQRRNILGDPDKVVDVRVPSRLLIPEEVAELNVRLNRNLGEWDWDALANNFETDKLIEWGFTEKELGLDISILSEDDDTIDGKDVPDAIWASDNDWGIPLLDINLQATALDLPFVAWGMGEYPRKSKMPGTWHFYTEDYRFEALWKDPSPVINSRAVNAVEVNFSVYNQMPPAVALWNIYRKRWVSRYWQSFGLRVFADLNVAEPSYELNMLGIPQGWKAWATRGYNDRFDSTIKEYEMACERAGTNSILFVVYGGGKTVKENCQKKGWLWFDELRNQEKGAKHG